MIFKTWKKERKIKGKRFFFGGQFLFFALFISLFFSWGCAQNNSLVELEKAPPQMEKARIEKNQKQRRLYQSLAKKGEAMEKDLEKLPFFQKVQVSLWPEKAIIDAKLASRKRGLSLKEKREVLRILIRYGYNGENTRLLVRSSPSPLPKKDSRNEKDKD
ncbi:MAG: hypothetical protein D6785_00975 [Planctomycetota bacterium]|nr:MAG: hypothetical protein D6785_00975 [Planctomycetota bacterium]